MRGGKLWACKLHCLLLGLVWFLGFVMKLKAKLKAFKECNLFDFSSVGLKFWRGFL